MSQSRRSVLPSTPAQARELLRQIDGVTTRGYPLSNQFYFVEDDIVLPPGFEQLFPRLDRPELDIAKRSSAAHCPYRVAVVRSRYNTLRLDD